MGIHRHRRSMMEDIWALWDPQGGVWPELGLICQPFFFSSFISAWYQVLRGPHSWKGPWQSKSISFMV